MPAVACTCGGVRRNGVCDRCGNQHKRERRGSATERGYDWRWRKFRARYLRSNPLCVDCTERGKVTPATDVHHIRKLRLHPEGKYDPTNLMPLCKQCHDVRTKRGE